MDIEKLKELRKPFEEHQISKLPKPTKAQTDEVKSDFKKGVRCKICGGWHHPAVIHLDYVGHAAVTDRLLDVDPTWNWEPVAVDPFTGSPVLDKDGGMWIRLTICGVTRLGYGDAEGKTGSNATKERIGDALRNAAMRFGAALDLWHKGELRAIVEEPTDNAAETQKKANMQPPKMSSYYEGEADKCATLEDLGTWYKSKREDIETMAPAEVKKINSYVSQLKAAL